MSPSSLSSRTSIVMTDLLQQDLSVRIFPFREVTPISLPLFDRPCCPWRGPESIRHAVAVHFHTLCRGARPTPQGAPPCLRRAGNGFPCRPRTPSDGRTLRDRSHQGSPSGRPRNSGLDSCPCRGAARTQNKSERDRSCRALLAQPRNQKAFPLLPFLRWSSGAGFLTRRLPGRLGVDLGFFN